MCQRLRESIREGSRRSCREYTVSFGYEQLSLWRSIRAHPVLNEPIGLRIGATPVVAVSDKRDEDWKFLEVERGVVVANWRNARIEGARILLEAMVTKSDGWLRNDAVWMRRQGSESM